MNGTTEHTGEAGMTSNREPHWWSWREIVERADRLGIPNFQRGSVWDTGNRVALLESVYEQSPCGSFVLWAPEDEDDPFRHGVPLYAFGEGITPLWLVDGQQRTRAMLDTFQQLLTVPTGAQGWALVRDAELASLRSIGGPLLDMAEDQDDEVSDDAGDFADGHFWGVVLPAMRVFDQAGASHFGAYSESRMVRRGSVFRRLSARSRVRVDSKGRQIGAPPLPVGVVPLATLVSPKGIFSDDDIRSAAEAALNTFSGENPDLQRLDDLIPWGPQFVTGHAFEGRVSADGLPIPIRWAEVHARRDGAINGNVVSLAGLFTDDWNHVFKRFADMLEGNRFAVGWLPGSDVSEAIDAYVRINRAGIRVRSEERALALLSRAHPGLLKDLADFVRLRGGDASVADQRSLLAHESDRQLGFPVWMSCVTRYSALALLGTSARHWLETSAIDRDTFAWRLDRVGQSETPMGRETWARPYGTAEELIQECSTRATQALTLVDSVLSVELLLDHRMARPSARGLLPLLDILYRVPDTAFRAAAGRLLHWTLLAPYIDQPDLKALVVDVHGITDEQEADKGLPLPPWGPTDDEWKVQLCQALGRYQRSLLQIWYRKHGDSAGQQGQEAAGDENTSVSASLTRLAVEQFSSEIRLARSLQHPAVGWLYAIERRGNAREFPWQAQIDGFGATGGKVGLPKPPGPPRREEVLCRANGDDAQGLYPEKQHIVPFSIARQIVGKGGTRATASPSNAIGNLTWLSRRQNSLDALSDRWTVMDREQDYDNLVARGMLARIPGAEGSQTALTYYEELQSMVLSQRLTLEQSAAQALFDPFCGARAAWMVEQMRDWLEEPLSDEASEWLGG
jgi:hypothetical protein